MKRDIFEFICPVNYLSYIFNAEPDNITEDEINRINNVLSGYSCFSATEDVFFAHRNDFFGFGADCVTLTALKNMIEHRCKFCGKLLFKATVPPKKTIYVVCPRCKKMNMV